MLTQLPAFTKCATNGTPAPGGESPWRKSPAEVESLSGTALIAEQVCRSQGIPGVDVPRVPGATLDRTTLIQKIMHAPFVPLFILLAIAIGFYLWVSGIGLVILLWPFGVRPMLAFGAKVKEVYGLDPATCDVNDFRARHAALWKQAESSKLATFDKAMLRKRFYKAMHLVLPRMSAMAARSKAASLELLADQLALPKIHTYFQAANLHWRLILGIQKNKPSEQELHRAYEKTLEQVQGSAKATDVVVTAMSRACLELDYD
jgi:hypothetical protein